MIEHLQFLKKLYNTNEVEISLQSAENRLEEVTNLLAFEVHNTKTLQSLQEVNIKDLSCYKFKVRRWQEIEK